MAAAETRCCVTWASEGAGLCCSSSPWPSRTPATPGRRGILQAPRARNTFPPDLPLPSAHRRRREVCSLIQQQPPPLGCKYEVHSEQQLPSCQFINPWCLNECYWRQINSSAFDPIWAQHTPRIEVSNKPECPSFICHCCLPRGKFMGECVSVIIVPCLVLTAPIKDAERSQGLIKGCHCAN